MLILALICLAVAHSVHWSEAIPTEGKGSGQAVSSCHVG